MKEPNERLAILNRIKAVAKRHSTFRVVTCIDTYVAAHYSDDWNECLNYLVSKGTLTTDGEGNYSLGDGK